MLQGPFQQIFGHPAGAEVFVPGRVNLIGEHTDYNGGYVLPAVIDPGVTVACSPNDLPQDRYHSTLDDKTHTRAPGQNRTGTWADYVGGMVDAVRRAAGLETCFDLMISSTLPHGAGVSSSAALMIAAGKALRTFAEDSERPSDVDLAKTAQAVENRYIGVPCGIMDQMAVAVGRPGFAIKLDTKSLTFEDIPFLPGYTFAVVHSGITRALEDGRYKERRQDCEDACRLLGVHELCGLPADTVSPSDAAKTPALRRARHIIRDHLRVSALAEAMLEEKAALCGEILYEGHRSYSQDFEVSTPEIDALVEAARQAGALGARLTGGGFGGCIVALVPSQNLQIWYGRLQAEWPAIRLVSPAGGAPLTGL